MDQQSNPGLGPEAESTRPAGEFDETAAAASVAAARKAQLEQAGLADLAPKHVGDPVNTAGLIQSEQAKAPVAGRHEGGDADAPPSLRVMPGSAAPDQQPAAGQVPPAPDQAASPQPPAAPQAAGPEPQQSNEQLPPAAA